MRGAGNASKSKGADRGQTLNQRGGMLELFGWLTGDRPLTAMRGAGNASKSNGADGGQTLNQRGGMLALLGWLTGDRPLTAMRGAGNASKSNGADGGQPPNQRGGTLAKQEADPYATNATNDSVSPHTPPNRPVPNHLTAPLLHLLDR